MTPEAELKKMVRNMGLCSKQAVVKNFKTCKDDATFGWGMSGKRIVAATQQVYILCHKEECGSVCVPEMWAHKTTVIDGAMTDKCFGFDKPSGGYVDHWHKASLMHAAAIEHARAAGYAPVAIIESDAVFVEAGAVDAGASAGLGGMDESSSFLRPGRFGADVIAGVEEDLTNLGDLTGGENGFSGKQTQTLKAMLGQTRWSADDERAMLELVASVGLYNLTHSLKASGFNP
jgi:hypothetical protein